IGEKPTPNFRKNGPKNRNMLCTHWPRAAAKPRTISRNGPCAGSPDTEVILGPSMPARSAMSSCNAGKPFRVDCLSLSLQTDNSTVSVTLAQATHPAAQIAIHSKRDACLTCSPRYDYLDIRGARSVMRFRILSQNFIAVGNVLAFGTPVAQLSR